MEVKGTLIWAGMGHWLGRTIPQGKERDGRKSCLTHIAYRYQGRELPRCTNMLQQTEGARQSCSTRVPGFPVTFPVQCHFGGQQLPQPVRATIPIRSLYSPSLLLNSSPISLTISPPKLLLKCFRNTLNDISAVISTPSLHPVSRSSVNTDKSTGSCPSCA